MEIPRSAPESLATWSADGFALDRADEAVRAPFNSPIRNRLGTALKLERLWTLTHTAEAVGVRPKAGVSETGSLAVSRRAAAPVFTGAPTPAAEDAFGARRRAVRVFGLALGIVAFAVGVVAPFGHIAMHVKKPPRVGCLLSNRMCGLAGIGLEPGATPQPGRVIAEGKFRL